MKEKTLLLDQKAYVIDFDKVKTMADIIAILKAFDMTLLYTDEKIAPIKHLVKLKT